MAACQQSYHGPDAGEHAMRCINAKHRDRHKGALWAAELPTVLQGLLATVMTVIVHTCPTGKHLQMNNPVIRCIYINAQSDQGYRVVYQVYQVKPCTLLGVKSSSQAGSQQLSRCCIRRQGCQLTQPRQDLAGCCSHMVSFVSHESVEAADASHDGDQLQRRPLMPSITMFETLECDEQGHSHSVSSILKGVTQTCRLNASLVDCGGIALDHPVPTIPALHQPSALQTGLL